MDRLSFHHDEGGLNLGSGPSPGSRRPDRCLGRLPLEGCRLTGRVLLISQDGSAPAARLPQARPGWAERRDRPDRKRPGTMGGEVESGAERVCDHLRRRWPEQKPTDKTTAHRSQTPFLLQGPVDQQRWRRVLPSQVREAVGWLPWTAG